MSAPFADTFGVVTGATTAYAGTSVLVSRIFKPSGGRIVGPRKDAGSVVCFCTRATEDAARGEEAAA